MNERVSQPHGVFIHNRKYLSSYSNRLEKRSLKAVIWVMICCPSSCPSPIKYFTDYI